LFWNGDVLSIRLGQSESAIHEQMEEARNKVAKMALIVAARNDSQAADDRTAR
jgi:hypothetical protein